MILKRVRVKNFRSILDATVNFGKHTAILGTNGAGKSTILRAIERFYGPSTSVDSDDFFGRNLKEPIEIALTYCDFNEIEISLFSERIHDNEMSVVRVFEASNSKGNGKYFGMTPRYAGFSEIRLEESALNKRKLYNALKSENPIFQSLPEATRGDQIEPALEEWENLNPEKCEIGRDNGQFFGFTNVGKGALQKATTFVFIPAVRDVSADAIDARGAVVAKLMELVVRSAIQQRTEIQKFQAEASEKFRQLTDPKNLPELNFLSENLSQTLHLFYADAGVGLKSKPTEDLSIPLPISDVSLKEDGFEGPVDRKGHGLQRAFIFTLLQHLAQATAANISQGTKIELDNTHVDIESENESVFLSRSRMSLLPGLILAIEEPELYQHPTKQRHFAKVLAKLSDGSLPGVAAQTQVMFASHSSLFVSPHRFEEIRLARRRSVDGLECKECVIFSSSLQHVARSLDEADRAEYGSNSVEGLLARLHVVNAEIAEGFFADGIILVEGESDRAAIKAMASLFGCDPEEFGIAVLQVGGKNNLSKIALLFRALAIPVYIVWDCDKNEIPKKQYIDTNKKLQRICGVAEEKLFGFATHVNYKFACFEENLESCLRSEIGNARYDQLLDEARDKYGMQNRDHVSKSSLAMHHVIHTAIKEGNKCDTLQRIIHGIRQMRFDHSTDRDDQEFTIGSMGLSAP